MIDMKKKETRSEFEKRRQRALSINKKLKEIFPDSKIILNYSSSWELLVAVILSAQCTDKIVNKVTEKLFKKYPKFDDYLGVPLNEFAQDIKSAGFYNNKAKNILATAHLIQEKFNGKVPASMNELLTLPGVARKTANVVLGNAFNIVEGIAVDTHVKRLSQKFKLSDEIDPNKIEKDLMSILPKEDWMKFTYRLIEYGRTYSTARDKDKNTDPISILIK